MSGKTFPSDVKWLMSNMSPEFALAYKTNWIDCEINGAGIIGGTW